MLPPRQYLIKNKLIKNLMFLQTMTKMDKEINIYAKPTKNNNGQPHVTLGMWSAYYTRSFQCATTIDPYLLHHTYTI